MTSDIDIFDTLINNIRAQKPEPGNYYQLSNVFNNFRLNGTKILDLLKKHNSGLITDLETMIKDIDVDIHILDDLCSIIKSYVSEIMAVLKSHVKKWFYYQREISDDCFGRLSDIMTNKTLDNILSDLKGIEKVEYHQVPDFLRYVRNMQLVCSNVTQYRSLLEELLNDNETMDNICRFFHDVIIKKDEKEYKKKSLGKKLAYIEFYAPYCFERHYVKYLQQRLLKGTPYDLERACNGSRNPRINGLINDMRKSNIIKSKLRTDVCKPVLINRKLWDIFNNVHIALPAEMIGIMQEAYDAFSKLYKRNKITWLPAVGEAVILFNETKLKCNMLQAAALIYLNENAYTLEEFSTKVSCSDTLIKMVIDSLVNAEIIVEYDGQYCANTCFQGPQYLDVNERFCRQLETFGLDD